MADQEKPKRLEPKKETTRDLFALSGNQCAFPGCPSVIIDQDGDYVGQVCHIRAANPEGERFDPRMTNEERRALANLLLLCYPHHTKTNDVEAYTVERMEKMKSNHEAKYSGALKRIHDDIIDEMDIIDARPATTLGRYQTETGAIEPEEFEELLEEVGLILERLQKVPEVTRQFLAKSIKRSEGSSSYNGWADRYVPVSEIKYALNLSTEEIVEHVNILDRYRFASVERDEERQSDDLMILNQGEHGWNFWSDILDFCNKSEHSIDELVVNLDFSILD